MKIKTMTWLLAASLVLPAALTWAEGSTVQKVEGKFNELKADSNRKDIRKDNIDLATTRQRREYWKDVSEDSLKRYNRARKAYGPSSELTRDAEDRHNKAVKEYENARGDHNDARSDLRKDERELNDAKLGINKK